jgi:hypothetical protein
MSIRATHPFQAPARDAHDAAITATRRLKTLQYELTPADVERLLSFAAEAEVAFALGVITERAAALLNKDGIITEATFKLEENKFLLSARELSGKYGIATPRSGFGGAMGPNLVDRERVVINPVHDGFEATVRGAQEAVAVVDQHAEAFVAALRLMLEAGHFVFYHDLLSKIDKLARELALKAGRTSYTADELALLGCSFRVSFQTWTGADSGKLTNFSQPLCHYQTCFVVDDPRLLAAQLECAYVDASRINVLLHAYAEAMATLVEKMAADGYEAKFVDTRALAALYYAPASPVRAATVPECRSPDENDVMHAEIAMPLLGKRKPDSAAEPRHHCRAPRRELSY